MTNRWVGGRKKILSVDDTEPGPTLTLLVVAGFYRVGVYFIKALHLFHTVKFEHIILRLENILYHQPTIQHAYLLYLYSIIMNYFSSF